MTTLEEQTPHFIHRHNENGTVANRILNTEPSSGALVTVISARCASAIHRAIERPAHIPRLFFSRAGLRDRSGRKSALARPVRITQRRERTFSCTDSPFMPGRRMSSNATSYSPSSIISAHSPVVGNRYAATIFLQSAFYKSGDAPIIRNQQYIHSECTEGYRYFVSERLKSAVGDDTAPCYLTEPKTAYT
jgi:hypothetical protein